MLLTSPNYNLWIVWSSLEPCQKLLHNFLSKSFLFTKSITEGAPIQNHSKTIPIHWNAYGINAGMKNCWATFWMVLFPFQKHSNDFFPATSFTSIFHSKMWQLLLVLLNVLCLFVFGLFSFYVLVLLVPLDLIHLPCDNKSNREIIIIYLLLLFFCSNDNFHFFRTNFKNVGYIKFWYCQHWKFAPIVTLTHYDNSNLTSCIKSGNVSGCAKKLSTGTRCKTWEEDILTQSNWWVTSDVWNFSTCIHWVTPNLMQWEKPYWM